MNRKLKKALNLLGMLMLVLIVGIITEMLKIWLKIDYVGTRLFMGIIVLLAVLIYQVFKTITHKSFKPKDKKD